MVKILNSKLITKKEYGRLFNPKILHVEYLTIVKKIEERCNEVIRQIADVDWWDFANMPEDHGEGHFDPDRNTTEILVAGRWKNWDKNMEESVIPIELLWTEYKRAKLTETESASSEFKVDKNRIRATKNSAQG